jgi:hypothetical protein
MKFIECSNVTHYITLINFHFIINMFLVHCYHIRVKVSLFLKSILIEVKIYKNRFAIRVWTVLYSIRGFRFTYHFCKASDNVALRVTERTIKLCLLFRSIINKFEPLFQIQEIAPANQVSIDFQIIVYFLIFFSYSISLEENIIS